MFRKLFFVFTILIIYSNNTLLLSETLTIDDLVERNDLYYKKFTNVPFTGEVSGIENGKFKNGIKDGEWLVFHENGQLWYKTNWEDGEKNGPYEVYYDNGQLKEKGNHKDGWEDGLWEYFNKDGSLKRTETWKEGKKIETNP